MNARQNWGIVIMCFHFQVSFKDCFGFPRSGLIFGQIAAYRASICLLVALCKLDETFASSRDCFRGLLPKRTNPPYVRRLAGRRQRWPSSIALLVTAR